MYSKIILLLALTVSVNVHAQSPFSSYKGIDGKDYAIQIAEADEGKDKGKVTLYIDALSFDETVNQAGWMIDEKELIEFRNSIEQAKVKYIEWRETAIANNVTELNKEMKIASPKVACYFSYGDWQFDFSVTPTYSFVILKDQSEPYTLLIDSGKLQSTSNQFIDCDGIALTFSSAEAVDDFLSKISQPEIDKYKNRERKENLFKD
jgi:hypothetical protein